MWSCGRLNQSWLLEKPQGTDVSSAARTLAANLQQLRTVGQSMPCQYIHSPAMKNPMSSVVAFGMAAAALSTRVFQMATFEMLFRMRRLQGD
jgi:hypothetical protein